MKIKRTTNLGKPKVEYKELEVSGRNVSPTTILGIPAPGTVFPVADLDNYDTFLVNQTSADTDEIQLPLGQPVGTVLTLYPQGIVRITGIGTEGINGGAATTEIPTVAGSKVVLEKVSATNWIATQYTSAGAVSAPTPA